MYKIRIICLGKLKEKAYKSLEIEYLKRLKPYAKVTLEELPEIPYRQGMDIDQVKRDEAVLIEKRLKKGGIVILLDEHGQERNSKDFARFIERIGGLGEEIIFIIGSGVGLHPSLKNIANYQVSLSQLTFPHNFVRILLEEQLYRAITILIGKDYHKS